MWLLSEKHFSKRVQHSTVHIVSKIVVRVSESAGFVVTFPVFESQLIGNGNNILWLSEKIWSGNGILSAVVNNLFQGKTIFGRFLLPSDKFRPSSFEVLIWS